jgi:hypothetical protein
LTIKQLRILPPFAIGRLGSADEPMDNYSFDLNIDHHLEQPLGYRQLKPQPTLIVNKDSGEIEGDRPPDTLEFKRGGKIRPVAPFLEVFAVIENDELVPLTVELLRNHNLTVKDIAWHVKVSNRKVVRRTQNPADLVDAEINFSDHRSYTLHGGCKNFIEEAWAYVNFGSVRFIRPNDRFPEIRLRFTPAAGLIYGPDRTGESVAAEEADPGYYQIPKGRQIYKAKGGWYGFHNAENETVPPALFAIELPAPSWLYHNEAVSRGYLDDACDGFVKVTLTLQGDSKPLTATARICAAPPAMAPDSMFVRTLADDLEQVIFGPEVAPDEAPETTLARAQDIVRRAYETVRFMNVAVMNGNNFKGRPALTLDSMPQEEAAGTQRAIRPIMPSGTVDTLAVMTLHQQVYAALRAGAAPWFLRLLRRPDEVADFTDNGRRKMPALMCGADNNYLALTWRQIDTIRKASLDPPAASPVVKKGLTPKNLSAQNSHEALSAQISYEAKGNPISSRPVTSVANCCPGLEVDFRAVWRRLFAGIELREYDNLVVNVDHDADTVVDCLEDGALRPKDLTNHRLLRVFLPTGDDGKEVPLMMMTPIWGPASSDTEAKISLTTSTNPNGLAALEWSNALARVLLHKGSRLRCDFSAEHPAPAKPSDSVRLAPCEDPKNYVSFRCEVRPFFEGDTAVISSALAEPGELTQGLCSPWQNDFRECSCYYWASARPDYVNVDLTASGLSAGDNWMQKQRTGSYVADDYADTRLIMYDDLFADWENLLKFQIGGKDHDGSPVVEATDKKQ